MCMDFERTHVYLLNCQFNTRNSLLRVPKALDLVSADNYGGILSTEPERIDLEEVYFKVPRFLNDDVEVTIKIHISSARCMEKSVVLHSS